MYIHNGTPQGPLTLFPPTSDQAESLSRYLLREQQDPSSCPLPIQASLLNGYRYHPDDAISRFNVFRDRYERTEPPTRSTHRRIMNGWNWPEMYYQVHVLNLYYARGRGERVDDAELAAAEEGRWRITPSSPECRTAPG